MVMLCTTQATTRGTKQPCSGTISKEKSSDLLAESELVDVIPFGASTNNSGAVTSVVGLYAKSIRMYADRSFQEDFLKLEKKLKGDIGFVASSENDDKWLVREFIGGPENLYVYDRSNDEMKFVFSNHPNLTGMPVAPRKAFEVIARDGLNIPVHVYLPEGSDSDQDGIPDKPLPTVMYVHGGPWVGIVHWNGRFHWRNYQLLANRGYAVIACEFRGTTGLGKETTDLSAKAWGTDMTTDKVDIANWAVGSGIAEAVGIWGWSYGGYAAMAGLAFSPETYACGISMYGISDLESFCRRDFANNQLWRSMVGDVSDSSDVQLLRDHSPINHVNKIQAPILMTTGDKDERVHHSQMDRMADKLKESGKKVTYFRYPAEVHDYVDPDSWISFWAAAEQFLAEHLGGRVENPAVDIYKGNKMIIYDNGYFGG